jgi:signal transduction histidine kinase
VVFNNEDGLTSNLVKAITQDSLGFSYIATDGGLVKFNGKNFENFQHKLPSLYIKDVYLSKTGNVLVLTDYGLIVIEQKHGVNSYTTLIKAFNIDTDSTLNYPKTIFEDSKGRLWISDLTGIMLFDKGKPKKYIFDSKYNADSYFRSFQVIEWNNKILATSMNGYFFEYDFEKNIFELLPDNLVIPNLSIDAVLNEDNNTLLIGTSKGLYRATINSSKHISFELISTIPNISALSYTTEKDLFIGTWHNGLYLLKKNSSTPIEVQLNISKSVKDIYLDNQNNIWIGTDGGVLLLKKTFFKKIKLTTTSQQLSNSYISQIVLAKNGRIYLTDGASIYYVNSLKDDIELISFYRSGLSNIYSIAAAEKGIWISFRDGRLEYRDHLTTKIIFQYIVPGDRFNALYYDSEGILWGYLGKSKRILKFDRNFNHEEVPFDNNNISTISFIKEDKKGSIIFGGNGRNAFLFEYIKDSKQFINKSLMFSKDLTHNLYITDIFLGDNVFYSTSAGLFDEAGTILEPQYLNQKLNLQLIKASFQGNDSTLWVGTENGIYALTKNNYILFDKSDDLPNSSVIARGIIYDKLNRLWVGTAGGLAVSQSTDYLHKQTAAPIISVYLKSADRDKKIISEETQIFEGSSVEFNFFSIAYPAERVQYQYRLVGGEIDSSWSSPMKINSMTFHNLSAGDYSFQVSARNTGEKGSKISNYYFNVRYNWYSSPFFIFVYVVLATIVVIFLTLLLNRYRINSLKEKEKILSQLVKERTDDLNKSLIKTENLLLESERSKEELFKANEFKVGLLNLAAHDLKNPLHSIIGFSSIIQEDSTDDEIKSMSEFILQSSQLMVKQIEDILQNAAIRANEIKIIKKRNNITDIVQKIIQNYRPQYEAKLQTIEMSFSTPVFAEVDNDWFSHVVDNLISNAIKYTPHGKSIKVLVENNSDNFVIKVIDSGPGIPESEMHLLFKEFQRLSTKPTGGESSTGFGLSIAKNIVQLHGGKIWATSKLGEGTTFYVQIPGETSGETN